MMRMILDHFSPQKTTQPQDQRTQWKTRRSRRSRRLLCFLFLAFTTLGRAQSLDEIFGNGFDGGTCAWSLVVPRPAVTDVAPGEGGAGSRIDIHLPGSRVSEPRVFLSSGASAYDADGIPRAVAFLDVVEIMDDHIVAMLPSGVPAGSYPLHVEACPGQPSSTSTSPAPFEVRLPSNLAFAPEFAAPGTAVTLTGDFLGALPGQITLRSEREPASGDLQVQILSWGAGTAGGPVQVVFAMPPDLPANGYYDVRVENSSGSVTVDAGLVGIYVADGDGEDLRVVSAVATGNTEVLVQFSEAVQGGENGAENPSYYRIAAPEASLAEPSTSLATLGVLSAEVLPPSLSTVRLTTLSQADLLYTLTVTNVRDLTGNPIAAPDRYNDPSTVKFYGVSPTGDENVDSDGDGLTDSDEQRGWYVEIRLTSGQIESRHVTSDPGNPLLDVDDPFNVAARDTDGDGVTDNEEKHGGMDPRSPDTDGDLLSDDQEWNTIYSDPTNQETDGDGIQDGFEFYTLRTSPILADTDGDQLADPDEVAAGNRDPLVADLPAPRIRVGSVNLQLDTRFTFTNESGEVTSVEEQSGTDLTRSENETFGTSNQNATKETLEFSENLELQTSIAVPPKAKFKVSYGAKQGSEQASTFRVDETSGRASEEAYHESLTTNASYDVRESITREVVGATIKANVTIENTSDIPFTISQLELSAQAQDPTDRRRMIPVASLVPENGGLESVNIGALGDPERGPFVFETDSVFPRQVEELLKNPRGLIVELANFDITDELGRNFAFVSREVLDRTAGITFDLGDGRVESYRVATASVHDRATGQPLGITLGYALESILGLHGTATIRAGGNGLAETAAVGDDVQETLVGSYVQPGEVIITAGPNGHLDTTLLAGDDRRVEADYDSRPPRSLVILDGGDGVVDTVAMGDDVQEAPVGDPVTPGGIVVRAGANGVLDTTDLFGDDVLPPGGGTTLTRFRDVATGLVDDPATPSLDETRLFWAFYSSKELTPGVALEDIILHAGDELSFTFVQDQDADGVWAREEYLHGSSDQRSNSDGCSGCNDGPVKSRTGPATFDTLLDGEEIQQGWRVQIKGEPQGRSVYPNPVQGDSDRDRLADHEEKACATDPRQRDTDLDGLTDWEELTGQRIVDGVAQPMVSRDPVTEEEIPITPYAGDGDNGRVFHESIAACDQILGAAGFATDPIDPDTDGDMVPDAVELQLGLDPNDPRDGGDFLDDDGDGVSNNDERTGYLAGVNCGDSPTPACQKTFTSNPNDPDTDQDGLPDLLERFLGSDPRNFDTDGDGLKDIDEYKGGGDACITVSPGQRCELFSSLLQDDFTTFLTRCALADRCFYDEDQLLAGRAQYGTNLNERDTDLDSADDPDELAELTITVNGLPMTIPAPSSDPLDEDTDGDGLTDGEEVAGPSHWTSTNPGQPDTDGDGKTDLAEVTVVLTDPAFKDRYVVVTSDGFNVTKSDDEGVNNLADMWWFADIRITSQETWYRVCEFRENGVPEGFVSSPCSYFQSRLRDDGIGIEIRMTARETDDSSADEICNTTFELFSYDQLEPRMVSHTCGSDPDLAFTTELKVTVDVR